MIILGFITFSRNLYEEYSLQGEEHAERCELHRVEVVVQQCSEINQRMQSNMGLLQQGIERASREIEIFEGEW